MNINIDPSDFLTPEFEEALQRALEKVLPKAMSQSGTAEPDLLAYPSPKAAEVLGGICEKTLWNYTQPRGSIPSFKIGTRTMYDPRDLQAWINAQKEGGK